ncbi:hypothetical protein ES705_38398 [subsurface metagenome]
MKQCEEINDYDKVIAVGATAIGRYQSLLETEVRKTAELESQRDDLLAACKMALKRKPFPVGWWGLKQALENAVARAEGET